MVRRLCLSVILLAALLVVGSGVQAQTGSLYQQPQGELFQRLDGSYGYIVSSEDRVGQWQVAFGSPQLWLELVAVNPQLKDPDRIWPGDELNVPPSLVRLFTIMKAANAQGTPNTPPITGIESTNPVSPAQVERNNAFAWMLLGLLVVAVVALLLQRVATGRERRRHEEFVLAQQRRAAREQREQDSARLADPYSGPPVVEGGLPTPEAAMEHFARTYQEERNRTTVGQAAQLPPRVNIDRIVPVWVWGEMGVRQGGSPTPVRKVLEKREPAWRAFLSDGSSRITLWRCGNDVYAGNGYDILPETQIEERTDLPSYTPAAPQQIWPEIAPVPVTAVEPARPVREFVDGKFTGPQRLVLHAAEGSDLILDIAPLVESGMPVTVGVQNGEVVVTVNGQRWVMGRIVGSPTTPAALPAGTDGSSTTSATGPSREQKVTEILAAAGESRS